MGFGATSSMLSLGFFRHMQGCTRFGYWRIKQSVGVWGFRGLVIKAVGSQVLGLVLFGV